MTRWSAIQTNFTAGELSPRIAGRVDLSKYYNGVEVLQNMILHPLGGISRRPGTRYIAPTKTQTSFARLIPFEFSTEQAYVLEFGHNYIRFYRNESTLTESPINIAGATQANPVVITASAHGFSNGQEVVLQNVGGMTQLNGKRFIVASATANTFALSGVNGTAYGAYTSGGSVSRIYEIASPYSADDVKLIRYTQSADVMYLVHPNHAPYKLSRTGHTSWTLTQVDFTDGPYAEINTNAAFTLSPSATSGTITISASGHAPFVSTDVGRLIRIKHSTTWGYAQITAFTSSTSVQASVKKNFAATSASSEWQFGSWSQTTGWPSCVEFYEDRLYFAASRTQPQTLWGSKSDDYENFTPGSLDDESVVYTINASRVNAIRWLSPGNTLVIGTAGGEFKAGGGATGEDIITPSKITVKRQTNHGVENIQPLSISNVVLFAQRGGRKLREFAYAFDRDAFVAADLTILADQVGESPLVELAYAQEPDSIIWAINQHGQLLGLTYKREEEVLGWHTHPMRFGQAQNSFVESIAVIPNPELGIDQLWLIIRRTINGQVRRYVEVLTAGFQSTSSLADAFYVDAGLTYVGAPTTVLRGLDHLEGETVAVLADGATHPDVVVQQGQITLTRVATKAHVGLSYVSRMRSLRFEVGGAPTAQGSLQRIYEVIVRFWRTLGAKIGPSLNDLDEIPFRLAGDPMDAPPSLVTGDRTVSFDGTYSDAAHIEVVQDQPLPMMVLSLVARGNTQLR